MNIATIDSRTRFGIAFGLALVLVILAELLLPPLTEDHTEVSALGIELPEQSRSPYEYPHRDNFSAILERPVFFHDRTLPPKQAPKPVAPPTPLRLQLEGVVMIAESKIAVFRNLEDNQLLQLAEGKSHSGWLLETVTANSAAFRRGNQVAALSFETNARDRRRR
jgi:hypothetical protein